MAPELKKIEVVFRIPEEAWHYIEAYGLNGWSWFDRCEFFEFLADAQVISKEHGRLIDADTLTYFCDNPNEHCDLQWGCNECDRHIITEREIDDAPTILEAWKGE